MRCVVEDDSVGAIAVLIGCSMFAYAGVLEFPEFAFPDEQVEGDRNPWNRDDADEPCHRVGGWFAFAQDLGQQDQREEKSESGEDGRQDAP